MEVEQDHMVMSGRYGGQEDDNCYDHIVRAHSTHKAEALRS